MKCSENKILSLLFFCYLLMMANQSSCAQGFELTFGGPGTQICNGITLGTDSSVYMLGYTDSGPLGGTDFMLSKVSLNGQLLWTKYLGTPHNDFGASVLLLSTGSGLALAGTTHDPILNEQVLIIVTDTSGVETSRYTYGTLESENINAAKLCPDGGYLLAGYTSNSGSNYAYILKLDSLFNTQWSNTYGGGINDYASEAIMVNSNDFYIASDRKFSAGSTFDYDVSVIRTDSTGNTVWDSVYHDDFQNGSQGIIQSNSGNLIVYGETEIYQFSPFDYFISSVDTNGNLNWRYTFGGTGTNALFDVVEDGSGNLVGTGYGNSVSNGTSPINLSLVKFDTTGTMIWQREYGYQSIDIGYRILAAPNGGYLIAGRANTPDDDDFYLLKVDDDGLTSSGAEIVNDSSKLSVYPNPVSDHFFVKSQITFTHLNLYDVMGRIVFTSHSGGRANNYSKVEIPDLPSGIYLLELGDSYQQSARTLIIKK